MASASSSIVATGSSRVAVSRHASLQPVSALRIKPFSNAKTTKSRAQGIAVGIRESRKSNNTRKPWPVYAAETEPVAEGEEAVEDDDVQYDIETEEDDMGEAEAVVELSDEELADRGFLTRQLSKLSDEALGTVATTAEEDAAAQEKEEGINQIIQTIMDIEKITSGDAETEEGAEAEESPMPFSDEAFYDEVYKNVLEIEAFGTDIKDYSAKDEVDYALVDAVASIGPDGLGGAYSSELDDKLAKYDIPVEEFTAEEQQILDLVESRDTPDTAPPRGINQVLSALQHQPLTDEEKQLLASAETGEIDPALKEELDQVLAISMMAAGVESKTDLTSAALLFANKLGAAAKETSAADLAAASKAALAKANAAGTVSDADLAALTAAAEELAGEGLTVPEDLLKALAEKLEEVETLGAVVEEEDDEEADAVIQARAAKVLDGQEDNLSSFAAIDAELNALQAPAELTSAATQFLENARAVLGDNFQKFVEESIQATYDPAQIAAAKEYFLAEAKAQLSAEQYQLVNNQLTDFGYAEASEVEVPELDVPSVKQFTDAPEVDVAVGEAIKEAADTLGPAPVFDASLYIRDSNNVALVEYNRLKAELKEATGVDLDNYRPKEKVVDENLLSAVAVMLRNAANGKPMAEGLDQLDIPQEPAAAAEPLSPELEEVRKQLSEVWASGDISFSQPEAPEIDESIFGEVDLTLPEVDEDEELSPEAGLITLPSETTPIRPPVAAQDVEDNIGEMDTADEAKLLEVSEEEWDEAARDVLLADGVVEEVDPQVALAKAEAALERFASKEGFDESDVEVLKEIADNLADVQLAVDPSIAKVRKAALLAKAVQEHASVVERAMASSYGPTFEVPEDLTREQAAQFVQAYGNLIEEALAAAKGRAQQGIYVRSLADAIANIGVPAAALDAEALEEEFRTLAAQTLSPEEVADAETNLPDGLITEDSIVEVPASEFEESLKERYTDSELEDLKAKAAALASPLDINLPEAPLSEEAQIDSLLAEIGVDVASPEAELDALVDAEAAVEQVEEAVEESTEVEEEAGDETAQAFKELLDEVIDEVRVATDSQVDDAVVYEAAADSADVEAEDEVEEDWEMDEGEAQAMLDEVLEAFANEELEAADEEADGNVVEDSAADADAEDEADADGEAELRTIFNTSATELLAQDYDDVWEAMGIPEARPKVPSKPRVQERDAEEAEEDEVDDYEEEEEVVDDGEAGEDDVADAIAEYYKADELDEDGDSRASLSAPKTTLDLFGSSPYLEDDGDRAADDTQGLLERVTVSKTGDIFVERIIQVNRVTKVVKGGKIMSFRCVAIVGNRNGIVGVGVGSAREVVQAVTKACQDAKANLIAVPLTKFDSIPHRVESKFKASIAIINPAADGTGCIAGGAVRSVLELAGVKNCLAKRLGSRNPLNNARATIKALEQLQTWGEVAGRRGVPIEYLFAKDESSAAKALAGNE